MSKVEEVIVKKRLTNQYYKKGRVKFRICVTAQVIDHLVAGMEDVVGYWGQHYWKDK